MTLKPLLRLLYRLNMLRWRIIRPILVGVRLIIERDGAVMLVRHSYQPGWYLPGGGLKRGETLEQAARREAVEESGAVLGMLRFFGVYSNFVQHKSDHIVVFACDDFHVTEQKSIEIESVDFFGVDSLPADVSPGSRRRINEYTGKIATPIFGRW
jgi:ADP-ribose pyrophosphatase YjhB (NUDIX family)